MYTLPRQKNLHTHNPENVFHIQGNFYFVVLTQDQYPSNIQYDPNYKELEFVEKIGEKKDADGTKFICDWLHGIRLSNERARRLLDELLNKDPRAAICYLDSLSDPNPLVQDTYYGELAGVIRESAFGAVESTTAFAPGFKQGY